MCSVDGCDLFVTRSKEGLCRKHYTRLMRTGDPLVRGKSGAEPTDPEVLFWRYVNKDAPGGCWLWMGAQKAWGYGQFRVKGKTHSAYRLAYEWTVGPIPRGLDLDHLCRVPACVNPAHLEPVTHTENVRRAWVARRESCVNGHPYGGRNTYIDPITGRRRCRQCRTDRRKAQRTP